MGKHGWVSIPAPRLLCNVRVGEIGEAQHTGERGALKESTKGTKVPLLPFFLAIAMHTTDTPWYTPINITIRIKCKV